MELAKSLNFVERLRRMKMHRQQKNNFYEVFY